MRATCPFGSARLARDAETGGAVALAPRVSMVRSNQADPELRTPT